MLFLEQWHHFPSRPKNSEDFPSNDKWEIFYFQQSGKRRAHTAMLFNYSRKTFTENNKIIKANLSKATNLREAVAIKNN